jgi:hypothetical protein
MFRNLFRKLRDYATFAIKHSQEMILVSIIIAPHPDPGHPVSEIIHLYKISSKSAEDLGTQLLHIFCI